MWSGKADAALLRIEEVKQQVCLDILTGWVYRVAFTTNELDDVHLMTILERERFVTCLFNSISCRLNKVTEPLQREKIVLRIDLTVSIPLTVL